MPWFKITLAYDGADFCGWQRQASVRTVQGVFEDAWRSVTGEAISVNASGRTDAGVHAVGQVVSVESSTRLVPATLVQALNASLPADVAVRRVEFAPDGFHATTDARWKRYRYLLFNGRRRPVLWRRLAWHIPPPLDVAAMRDAGQQLVGRHDYSSFQTAGSYRQSTVRTIYKVEVHRSSLAWGPPFPESPSGSTEHDRNAMGGAEDHLAFETQQLLAIDVTGDGFLYHMVRAIAGTLVRAGRGRLRPQELAAILASCDRSAAGQTAPAYGLTLVEVGYAAEIACEPEKLPQGESRGGEGGEASVPPNQADG